MSSFFSESSSELELESLSSTGLKIRTSVVYCLPGPTHTACFQGLLHMQPPFLRSISSVGTRSTLWVSIIRPDSGLAKRQAVLSFLGPWLARHLDFPLDFPWEDPSTILQGSLHSWSWRDIWTFLWTFPGKIPPQSFKTSLHSWSWRESPSPGSSSELNINFIRSTLFYCKKFMKEYSTICVPCASSLLYIDLGKHNYWLIARDCFALHFI